MEQMKILKVKKNRRTSRLFHMTNKNKIITAIIGITITLCITNVIFIYNFFVILSKV